MRQALIGLAGAAVVAAVVVVMALSFRGEPTESIAEPSAPARVLFVGIDGLDWERVNRLADEGRMPNIARLREEGSSGMLESVHPFVSPTVWTTIATGKSEEKHGISGFTVNKPKPGESAPSTSNMRRVSAVWQILSAAQRSVGVIGWLVTYPADTVSGYLVSSHVTLALSEKASSRAPNQTDEWLGEGVHPPEMWQEVAQNVVREDEVPESVVMRFLGGDFDSAMEEEPMRTSSLSRFYASDMTSLTLARHFSGTTPTDFTAVYFRGTDMASHFFWRFMEPETWRRELDPRSVEIFSPVVERYYAFADSLLGEVVSLVGDDTVVMVCSDHGFAGHVGYRGFEGDVAVGTEMHRKDGIFFVAGPGIARGREVKGGTVYDITPTILALFGLPVARDMDGRPLAEAFDQAFLDSSPITYVDTYEIDGPKEGDLEPVESPVDEEIQEMLRSLGYID